MGAYTIYEVDVSYEAEDQRRDVDGWVSGHAPGCGKFRRPQKETFRVVCARQQVAVGYVLGLFDSSDYREVRVIGVRQQQADAVIAVH